MLYHNSLVPKGWAAWMWHIHIERVPSKKCYILYVLWQYTCNSVCVYICCRISPLKQTFFTINDVHIPQKDSYISIHSGMTLFNVYTVDYRYNAASRIKMVTPNGSHHKCHTLIKREITAKHPIPRPSGKPWDVYYVNVHSMPVYINLLDKIHGSRNNWRKYWHWYMYLSWWGLPE